MLSGEVTPADIGGTVAGGGQVPAVLVKHGARASGESRVGWTQPDPPAMTIGDVGVPRKEEAIVRTTRTFGGMWRAGETRSRSRYPRFCHTLLPCSTP